MMKNVVAKALARYFICPVKNSLCGNIVCEIALFEEFIDLNEQEIPLVQILVTSPPVFHVYV